ncbi:MAG: hypothetical protein IT373_02175 [Polyangiaceae bacterium]|nr:hypothetical protein [Polyangiaceae bacterium]
MPDTPLGCTDVFHLRADQEMRRRAGRANACVLGLELGGALEPAALAARVREAGWLLPELGWRLRRAAIGDPCWRALGPRTDALEVSARGSGDDDRAWLLAQLEHGVDGARPWRLLHRRGRRGDLLVLHWFHPLCDARGAARLLAWLGAPPGALEAPPEPGQRFLRPESLLPRSARARTDLARAYARHAMGFRAPPVVSPFGLARAASGGRAEALVPWWLELHVPPLGRLRALRLHLDPATTRTFDAGLRARARLAETGVLAWAALRLLDRLVARRGLAPRRYVVPIPLSLEPARGGRRFFGNQVSMMLLALEREALGDEATGLAALAEAQRDIVRRRLDLGMLAAAELSRRLPEPFYGWLARRPFGGERGSLVVSHPGVLDVGAFLGVPVVDAWALPAAMAPPGFQVIASRHRGSFSAWIMFLDGLVSEREVAGEMPAFARDLCGQPVAPS